MTTNSQTTDIRSLPLAALTFSQTRAQIERREHFDKAALAELAESIKSVGLVQPILVRPGPDRERDGVDEEVIYEPTYEVVAGERRVLAAREAGLEEILGTVRDLTDEQVLELQLVENLQRQDLHELAEAEGYEALQKLGHSVEEMAARIGKSKATIYARMKLLALCDEGRAHLYGGNLSASSALLVARLPQQVQKQALKDVAVREEEGPLSYREVARILHDKYFTSLTDAPFDVKVDGLVKGAPPCGKCPKNTISQPELFDDVKATRAGVCTDPGCFRAKREAHGRLLLAKGRENGQAVFVGQDAKKISPYGGYSLAGGYARLDQICYDDPKQRTYQQILGKGAKPALLQEPGTGDVVEIVRKADVLKQLEADGAIAPEKKSGAAVSGGGKSSRKDESALQRQLFLAIHKAAPKKLARESLERLTENQLDLVGTLPDFLTEAWGWDADMASFDKLSEPQLHQLLWELLVFAELPYSPDLITEKLTTLAKALKIDVAAIRKRVAAEHKAPPQASKKKVARQ